MMNRREALGSLSAFAFLGSILEAQTAMPASSPALKVFRFTELSVTRNAAGAAGRGVPQDLVPEGDLTEIHITTLDPGKEYGPMRKNPNIGFRMVHTGKMEILVEGMPPVTAEAGDIVYAPQNLTFQVRNGGDTPLTYFIIQIKPKPVAAS